MLAKSLGLFDIQPDATVAKGHESLNIQDANRHFRVCHMVIVATVGFRGVLGEFWKSPSATKFFPVWSPTSSSGLSQLLSLSDLTGRSVSRYVATVFPAWSIVSSGLTTSKIKWIGSARLFLVRSMLQRSEPQSRRRIPCLFYSQALI